MAGGRIKRAVANLLKLFDKFIKPDDGVAFLRFNGQSETVPHTVAVMSMFALIMKHCRSFLLCLSNKPIVRFDVFPTLKIFKLSFSLQLLAASLSPQGGTALRDCIRDCIDQVKSLS